MSKTIIAPAAKENSVLKTSNALQAMRRKVFRSIHIPKDLEGKYRLELDDNGIIIIKEINQVENGNNDSKG